MQADPHKRAIRSAFASAAQHYDSVAHVQRRIADALLAKCATTTGIALDAGSGTGYALAKLHALSARCVALDHAEPMLRHASHGESICGDIDALPLRDASIALYYSSLAWQWTDTITAITEASRSLQTGGQLAVASLGPDTLQELRDAFRQADNAEHVRSFAPVDGYAPQLAAAGFENIEIERVPFVAHAADFRTMLRDIKMLGAHVVHHQRPQGLFGLERFRRAEAHYERLREGAGLPITYDAIFITARRTKKHHE